jgi:hypothetical protein
MATVAVSSDNHTKLLIHFVNNLQKQFLLYQEVHKLATRIAIVYRLTVLNNTTVT